MPVTTPNPHSDSGDRLPHLTRQIGEEARALGRFLALLVLTVVLALVRLLPFGVRVLTMLGWIIGMALAFQAAHDLFAILADEFSALLAGICAVAVCLAIPAAFLATERRHDGTVWGGFALAAAVALGMAGAMTRVRDCTDLYPVVNSLPVVLAGTLLVFIALKVRRIHEYGRRTQTGRRSA